MKRLKHALLKLKNTLDTTGRDHESNDILLLNFSLSVHNPPYEPILYYMFKKTTPQGGYKMPILSMF